MLHTTGGQYPSTGRVDRFMNPMSPSVHRLIYSIHGQAHYLMVGLRSQFGEIPVVLKSW